MELVLAVFVLAVVFFIGYMVGEYQMSNKPKSDSITYTSGGDIWTPPTSSLNEVPAELLMGGDIERALHIAGVKEASLEKQKEWADERKAQIEEKSALSDKQLMEYLESKNEELLVKAGIKQYDRNKGVEDLTKKMKTLTEVEKHYKVGLADIATPKGYDPLKEEKMKREAARKQAQKDREEMEKIDFEALPMSRISNEARKKIAEIVRKDIADKLEEASVVLPANYNEVKDNETKKPKTKKPRKVK